MDSGLAGFLSSDSAHSMMCAVGKNVMVLKSCSALRILLSHHHPYADLLTWIEHIRWKVVETCINAFWLYSVKSVSKMYLFLMVAFLIFVTIYGVACGKLVQSSLGDRWDIFITHLIIIIKSEVSAFPIVVIFSVVVYLMWLYYHMLPVSCISRKKLDCVSFITAQPYSVWKWSSTL